MFSLERCSESGCRAYVFPGSSRCYRHSPDREHLRSGVEKRLKTESIIRDISIVGASFRSIRPISGARITGSNFSFCCFEDCDFSSLAIYASFFDFCIFHHCTFSSIDARYAVFSGSSFIDTEIHGSTIIHTNFMGIDAERCDFSSNDFYYSNFSLSRIVSTSMEDCNLKRTSFRSSITKGVSFRYSNPEEAYFRREEQ